MALLRVGLGLAQVFGASFSVVLLLQVGVTKLTLISVALTGLCTTVSILLFGGRQAKARE